MDRLWRCSTCLQWVSEDEPLCPFCSDALDAYMDDDGFFTPAKRQKSTIDVVSDSDGEDLYGSGTDGEPYAGLLMKWSCFRCRAVYDVAIPECPDCDGDVEIATPLSLTRAKSCSTESDLSSGQLEDTVNKTTRIVECLTRCYEIAFANACESVVGGDESKKRARSAAAKELRRSVVLCKPGVVHMSQRGGVQLGSGWACGYRNIQMLCSSLLTEPAFNSVLFGGCGFVPEIPFIQAWIQRAWRRGYDADAADHFSEAFVGGTEWIGTTECAALLRSFGIPAAIQTFQSHDAAADAGKTAHAAMIDWVWQYFENGSAVTEAHTGTVRISNVFPLYLQHDGHSRLIIGAERRYEAANKRGVKAGNRAATKASASLMSKWLAGYPVDGSVASSSSSLSFTPVEDEADDNDTTLLLVLDPAVSGWALRASLERCSGWERHVKRGMHTLKKPEYQVVVVPRSTLLSLFEQEKAKNIMWSPLAAGIREEFATKSAQLSIIWTELSEESRLVAITTARDSTIKTLASVMASSDAVSSTVIENVRKQVTGLCPELETSRLPLLCREDMLLKWVNARLEHRDKAIEHDLNFVTTMMSGSPATEDKVTELATTRELYLLTFIKEFIEFIVAAAESVAPSPNATKPALSSLAPSVMTSEDPDGPILDVSNCHPDPIVQFGLWFDEALAGGHVPVYGMPMTLATCTRDGFPSARIVLLKSHDPQGFTFYTNYSSRKGGELMENPRAALVIFWPDIYTGRQIRVEGIVERVPDAESDAYFHSRPESARIGCWASPQSQPIPSRESLMASVEDATAKYSETREDGSKIIPRPPHWGGFRVNPTAIEFWRSGGRSRLHDRVKYVRSCVDGVFSEWSVERLAP